MAHFKRRRRRKAGIKGHCTLCSIQKGKNNGLRNGRIRTWQERQQQLSEPEGLSEYDDELAERYFAR